MARRPGPMFGKTRPLASNCSSTSEDGPATRTEARHNNRTVAESLPIVRSMVIQIAATRGRLPHRLRPSGSGVRTPSARQPNGLRSLRLLVWLYPRLVRAEAQTGDRFGAQAPGAVRRASLVGLDDHGVHLDIAGSDLKARWEAIEELLDDARPVHADHAVVRPGHADIAAIGGAAGKHAFVGGRDVRVCADDGGNASVEIPAHGDFLAGRFRVHINQNESHVGRHLGELRIRFLERIVDRGKEHAAFQIEHGEFRSILGDSRIQAAARIAFRKIRGPKQAWLVWQVVKDFLAIPTVVATGQDLYAVAEQVFRDARRNAEAGSRVFAVGDDEVDVVVLDEIP